MTRRMLPAVLLAILILTGQALVAAPVAGQAGRFTVQVTTDPSPPREGTNLFGITVLDGGKPLSGAGVTVHVDMVDMPMPADFQAAPAAAPGQYQAEVNLAMAGKWRVDVAVREMAGMKMAGDGTARFLLETGKSLTASGGGGLRGRLPAIALVLLLAVGVALLVRYRQQSRVRGVVAGLLTLGVVFVATVYVVNKYRDPTVATVVGSATMDMDAMQAAPGTVPVEVETVRRGPFSAEVTYTGTVVPEAEEEVFPRVAGRVVYMALYPGDHVTTGQVVARLEARELSASAAGAAGGVEAALADQQAARQAVAEAASGVDAAEASLEQARAEVGRARGEQDTAQAEVTLAQAEAGRAKRLYDMGAISRQELDRKTAQAGTAAARLAQSAAGVRAAQAGVNRAEQELAQAHARHAAAQAAAKAATGRVQAARAASREAAVLTGYTEIRAGNTGVVTARNVVPGVVVQPGTSLLRIAKTDRVRLQASVTENDLAGVRIGARLTARTIDAPDRPITGTISAIFPARDPATRTSVVEAIVPNPGGRLQPGQYLTITLGAGGDRPDAISVPNRALTRREGQTWVLVAQTSGMRTVARQVAVTTGRLGNQRTEITSGLEEGDRVIVTQGDLRDGDAVTVLAPQARTARLAAGPGDR